MIFKEKHPFIESGNDATQKKPVFAYWPVKIGQDWVWWEPVIKVTRIWGWGFVDIWYEREK